MSRGFRVRGEGSIERRPNTLNRHWADRNGWMYLCDCARAIRIGGEVKHALCGRHRRSKINTARWIALGAR